MQAQMKGVYVGMKIDYLISFLILQPLWHLGTRLLRLVSENQLHRQAPNLQILERRRGEAALRLWLSSRPFHPSLPFPARLPT